MTKGYRFNCRSFCSGKGTDATVFAFWNIKLQWLGLVEVDFFVVTHGADVDPVCQAILLVHMHPLSSIWPSVRHVFGDFSLDRFSNFSEIEKLMPDDADPWETRYKAYQDIGNMLIREPKRFLPDGTRAWCYRHRSLCPVKDFIGLENDSAYMYHDGGWAQRLQRGLDDDGNGSAASALDSSSSSSSAAAASQHPKAGPEPEPQSRYFEELDLLVGGTTCVDHVDYGGRDQEAGRSMQAFNAFCADAFAHDPTFVCCEISGLTTISFYARRLGHQWHLIGIQLCPQGMGFGGRRNKLYIWGTHFMKAKHHGSAKMFVKLFRRSQSMSAAGFFVATPAERYEDCKSRAASQGNYYPQLREGEEPPKIPLGHQFSPYRLHRLKDFKRAHFGEEHDVVIAVDDEDQKDDAKPSAAKRACWLVDLEQNEAWTKGGAIAPPLVTHGLMTNLVTEEILVPKEHLLLVGEPVVCGACDEAYWGDSPWQSCISKVVDKLDQTERGKRASKRLAGNAQALPNHCVPIA